MSVPTARVIWKYKTVFRPLMVIEIPQNAVLRTCELVPNTPYEIAFWFEHDAPNLDAPNELPPKIIRRFKTYATGEEIPGHTPLLYIKTVFLVEQVWHIFEDTLNAVTN